ncbi:MAG: LapA family protein [Candidatus Dechloromonas phosphoritropha]|jgi:uncharacterized integral membrane protein
MQLTIIAAIFVAIAGVFFAMQNNIPVTVNFLLWRFDGSLAMVLLLAVAMGATMVALLTTPATLRRQWLVARQKRRVEELERDNELQKAHIAKLEESSGAPGDISASPPPYVGLKQIVMSRQGDPADEEDKPGN